MSWEALAAISAFLTAIVIAATAIAALVQLRHMRAANAITGVLGFMDKWATPEHRKGLNYVFQGELDQRLKEPEFRQELMRPWVDRLAHPEVALLDYWENLATFIKMRYTPEEGFMETGGSLCIAIWNKLVPVIAVMRRTRGPQVYDNLEWLAARCVRWEEKHSRGTYPKDTAHMPVKDPFPEDASPA